jgi:DNA-binding transcriptional regulator LsrR (DeoR family)
MSDKTIVETRSRQGLRLEQAARAAWLYYVGRRTQDEVASQLNISRQAAQRLISLALTEKLIKFRFDHEVGPCMEAGDALSRRFGLALCEVVPTMGNNSATLGSVAIAGAQFLEKWLSQRAPLVLGLGTGRTLRAIANELSPIAAPQHKVFSQHPPHGSRHRSRSCLADRGALGRAVLLAAVPGHRRDGRGAGRAEEATAV